MTNVQTGKGDGNWIEFTFIEQLFIIFICSCCLLGGIFFGRQMEKESFKKEAVKHKAAHWNISDEGVITFEWNTLERPPAGDLP
jgi:hypothetical protein